MSKKNEVATAEAEFIPTSELACLNPDNEAMEAFAEACTEEGFSAGDLTRITVPSQGATKWAVPDEFGEEQYVKEITGLFLAIEKSGVLWESEEWDGSGDPPLLSSHDLLTARNDQNVDFPEHMKDEIEKSFMREDDRGRRVYNWTTLSYAQFGSGKGKGKRVSEGRLVYILPIGEVLPLVIQLPSASIKGWAQDRKALKVLKPRPLISLTLEKVTGTDTPDYSKIVMKPRGAISREDGKAVKAAYRTLLSEVIEPRNLRLELEAQGATPAQIAEAVGEDTPAIASA